MGSFGEMLHLTAVATCDYTYGPISRITLNNIWFNNVQLKIWGGRGGGIHSFSDYVTRLLNPLKVVADHCHDKIIFSLICMLKLYFLLNYFSVKKFVCMFFFTGNES